MSRLQYVRAIVFYFNLPLARRTTNYLATIVYRLRHWIFARGAKEDSAKMMWKQASQKDIASWGSSYSKN